MPRTPFRDISGPLVADCGRSGMKPKPEKPPAVACCSIGCGNWVGRNRIPLVKGNVQEVISPGVRLVQQSRDYIERSITVHGSIRISAMSAPMTMKKFRVPLN